MIDMLPTILDLAGLSMPEVPGQPVSLRSSHMPAHFAHGSRRSRPGKIFLERLAGIEKVGGEGQDLPARPKLTCNCSERRLEPATFGC